jgi:Icc-related predicted phosphoesterase
MIKICTISDTHNQFDKIKIPKCDILIHAGDISLWGKFQHLEKIMREFQGLKISGIVKKIILISGNHDVFFEQNRDIVKRIVDKITYLEDSATKIGSLKIYGSPWTPRFGDWAFNLDRGHDIKHKWRLIPKDTDILISHGPPFGIRDFGYGGIHVGCKDLLDIVNKVNPKIHIFGHCHSGYGTTFKNETLFINASICNSKYKMVNNPILFEIDETTKEVKLCK